MVKYPPRGTDTRPPGAKQATDTSIPALGAPAAVSDAVGDGEVQRGPLCSGLASRHDLDNVNIFLDSRAII